MRLVPRCDRVGESTGCELSRLRTAPTPLPSMRARIGCASPTLELPAAEASGSPRREPQRVSRRAPSPGGLSISIALTTSPVGTSVEDAVDAVTGRQRDGRKGESPGSSVVTRHEVADEPSENSKQHGERTAPWRAAESLDANAGRPRP